MARVVPLVVLLALGAAAVPIAPASAGDRPRVELLDPGAEPRAPLRIEAREGQESAFSFRLEQGIEQEIDGAPVPTQQIPAIREDVVVRVERVRPNGRITYRFDVVDVAVVDAEGFAEEDVQDLEEALEPLAELGGEFVVNERGIPLRSQLDAPDDAPAIVEDLLSEFEQQLSNFAAPYPNEPVGVGARWTSTASVRTGGIHTDITYEYELLAREGDRLTLAVTYAQSAEPQPVELRDVPESARVRLSEYDIAGSGQIVLSLTEVVPSESAVSASGDQVFVVRYQGERQTLRQTVSLEVTAEPTPT
jgi:hypothetical protein